MASILVADDDKTYRESIQKALEHEGHSVEATPDVDGALEALHAGRNSISSSATTGCPVRTESLIPLPGIEAREIRRSGTHDLRLRRRLDRGPRARTRRGRAFEETHPKARLISEPPDSQEADMSNPIIFKDLPATFPEKDRFQTPSLASSALFHVLLVSALVVVPAVSGTIEQWQLTTLLVSPLLRRHGSAAGNGGRGCRQTRGAEDRSRRKDRSGRVDQPGRRARRTSRTLSTRPSRSCRSGRRGVRRDARRNSGRSAGGILAANALAAEMAAPPPPPPPPPPPSRPAASTPPAKPIFVGGNIKEPRVVKLVPPTYPPLAVSCQRPGCIGSDAYSGRNRRRNPGSLRTIPLLINAAIECVKQWVYEPTYLNGVASVADGKGKLPSEESVVNSVLERYDRPAPRYTSYPPSPHWKDAGENFCVTRSTIQPGLSIYVHVPFCERLCLYCGCNVIIRKDHALASPYLEHLLGEMDLLKEAHGRLLTQMHWGGDARYPDSGQIKCRRRFLFDGIISRFSVAPGAEISIIDRSARYDEGSPSDAAVTWF